MDYGSRVWWKGQEGLAGKVDKVDERGMRRLGGHYRTAPGKAIAVENDMIPAKHRYDNRSQRIACKALLKDTKHPMRMVAEAEMKKIYKKEKDLEWGKKEVGEKEEYGVRRGIKKIRRRTRGGGRKIEKSKDMDRKERKWEKRIRQELVIRIGGGGKDEIEAQKERAEGNNEVIMYSDGSRREDGSVGVGVCRIVGGIVKGGVGLGLGKEMEIMDAEMVGIRVAIEEGIKQCKQDGKTHLTIRLDSQEAMRRVRERKRGKGEMMAHDIRWWVDKANTHRINVTLEWVKGHANIFGNEAADTLAKVGTGKNESKHTFTSIAWIERSSREESINNWSISYRQDKRQAKHYHAKPETRHSVKWSPEIREDRVIISQLRTEHIKCNKYLFKLGKAVTPVCECGNGDMIQDVYHILSKCELISDVREEAEEKMGVKACIVSLLYLQTGVEWGVKLWKEFVKRSRERRWETEQRKIEEEEREDRRGYGELEWE